MSVAASFYPFFLLTSPTKMLGSIKAYHQGHCVKIIVTDRVIFLETATLQDAFCPFKFYNVISEAHAFICPVLAIKQNVEFSAVLYMVIMKLQRAKFCTWTSFNNTYQDIFHCWRKCLRWSFPHSLFLSVSLKKVRQIGHLLNILFRCWRYRYSGGICTKFLCVCGLPLLTRRIWKGDMDDLLRDW